MKKSNHYLLLATTAQLLFAGICTGQSITLALKAPAANIVVDGNAKEWGDSLSYYNPESKIHYTIANDKENIYLVVKTNDPVYGGDIINGGITFSIDTKGRKKSTYKVTFPEATDALARVGRSIEEKAFYAQMTRTKKIAVSGFKDIDDEDMATANQYNIKVAMDYDQQGDLVYEEAIPLTLFHAGDLMKGEWSFNIKINGIELSPAAAANPAQGDGSGMTQKLVGVPSGSPSPTGINSHARSGSSYNSFAAANNVGANSSKTTPSIDFWGKFSLAAQ